MKKITIQKLFTHKRYLAMGLALLLCIGAAGCGGSSSDDYPLPADFSGTYVVSVGGASTDARASVTRITLVQAASPDGSVSWSLLNASIPGYTFVKGDIEGESDTKADFDLDFTNASGGKMDVDGVLIIEGNTIKMYAEWDENHVETRVTGTKR